MSQHDAAITEICEEGFGIPCPHCKARKSRVVYTRPKLMRVMRVRKCKTCKKRFVTWESGAASQK